MNLALHPVDIAVLVYAVFALVRGLKRGLSSELVRLIGGLGVLGTAIWLYPGIGNQIHANTRLENAQTANLLAFCLLLVVGYVLLLALRLLLRALLDFQFKGSLERTGGAITGLVRASTVVVLLVLTIGLWSHGFFYVNVIEESFTGRQINGLVGPAYADLAERFPEYLPMPGTAGPHEPGRWDETESAEPSQETSGHYLFQNH